MWDDLETEIEIFLKGNLGKTKNIILGKGNKSASILFVLENISTEEEKKGDLLSDEKGQYLKKFLEYAKLDLEKCYFTTLVKYNYEGTIKKSEMKKWSEFLDVQISLLNPKYIISVGEKVTEYFLKNKLDILKIVGNSYNHYGIKLIPIYDISYLFKATGKEKWKLVEIFSNLE